VQHVRGVVAPRNAAFRKQPPQLSATHREERAQERWERAIGELAHRQEPGERREPDPATKTEEEALRPVVCGVRRDRRDAPMSLRKPTRRLVARRTRAIKDVPAGVDLDPHALAVLDSKFGGKRERLRALRGRLLAEAVIDRQYGKRSERRIASLADGRDQEKHRHRVSAAADEQREPRVTIGTASGEPLCAGCGERVP
jgi:hypothetical protein